MDQLTLILISACAGILLILFLVRITLSASLKREEQTIVDFYRKKVDKIPALIETMREGVAEEKSLETITRLHREAILMSTRDMVDVLEMNARIEKEFLFLMKLSAQIPNLQLQKHFIYIRDFIIQAERDMRGRFSLVNSHAKRYNTFINWKNMTIIGLLLPAKKRPLIGDTI
jgi:hypothetical protein